MRGVNMATQGTRKLSVGQKVRNVTVNGGGGGEQILIISLFTNDVFTLKCNPDFATFWMREYTYL